MKTRNELLLDILSWEDTEFIIPPYQRPYSWQERECRELWRDILQAGRLEKPHFIGTLLYSEKEGSTAAAKRLVVVDGQQRLTTVTLILAVLRDVVQNAVEAPAGLSVSLLEQHLLLKPGQQERAPKLTLSRKDASQLPDVLLGGVRQDAPSNASPSQSRVKANFALLRSLTEEEGFDPETLWAGLRQLTVISASLDESDPAQSIFESLNSKGLPLTTADLVRNYLLLAETHAEQTRLYNKYWRDIEGMFQPDPGSLRLDNAIQGWLSVRFRKVRAKGAGEVYSVFKRYMEDEFTGSTDSLLRELRGFCMTWGENYRHHAVNKYKSAMSWAEGGAATLTSQYEKKPAVNGDYAQRLRASLDEIDPTL